jgi:hypothetical protein
MPRQPRPSAGYDTTIAARIREDDKRLLLSLMGTDKPSDALRCLLDLIAASGIDDRDTLHQRLSR